MTKTLLL